MRIRFGCIALLLLCAPLVSAQTVIAPTVAQFAYADADLATVASFTIQFYQCGSLSAGACVGQAATAFQTVTVPVASVTTLTPPNSFGDNRSISLTAAPIAGTLGGMPAGVPFVATLAAVGDPNQGVVGTSAGSPASNPFFASPKPPQRVLSLRMR